MTSGGFHLYLQQHIQDMTKSISRKAFAFEVGEHVAENAIEQLKNAYNTNTSVVRIHSGCYLTVILEFFWMSCTSGLKQGKFKEK